MEHKIILGGEHLLPLARSRIKALRAMGLEYASQTFVIEGCTVNVKIQPGLEFIRLEGGGSASMAMDSGIISAGPVTSQNPDRFIAGRRAHIPIYEATFTEPVAGTPYFLNPGKTSAGQLAGIITKSSQFAGKVRKDDVVESFARQTTGTDTNGVRIENEADETLLAKKRAGVYCPASMFTGRARLFAQALYGQPLYGRKKGDKADDIVPTPTWGLRGIPALSLVIYIDPDVERREAFAEKVKAAQSTHAASGTLWPFPNPYAVTLNVSSGVYFDPSSKKHWLMNPGEGEITIYPLISSKAGEAMRRSLGSSKLTKEDSDHLEAYILSACRPHVEVAQTLSIASIYPYASGYGWHWNWSGTTADMVQIAYLDAAGGTESTHYRLTATATFNTNTKTTTWSASASTVSGPTYFAMPTPVCCVTHPNWLNRYVGEDGDHAPVHWSEKLTINYDPVIGGLMRESDAPIYAFYQKDTLQIARYSFSRTGALPGTADFSKRFARLVSAPTTVEVLQQSLGLGGGYLRVISSIAPAQNYTVSCGGSKVETKTGGTTAGYNIIGGGKTEMETPPDIASGGYGSPTYTVNMKIGAERDDGTFEEVVVIATGGLQWGYNGGVHYVPCTGTTNYDSEAKYYTGTCGGIIPFYDAEAFYMVQDNQTESFKTARRAVVGTSLSVGYSRGMLQTQSDTGGPTVVTYYGWFKFWLWQAPSSFVSDTTLPDETTTTSVKTQLAVFSNGAASSPEPHPATYEMFENGDFDFVFSKFDTISSAGSGKHFRGLVEQNWPVMPGLIHPIIVGWV